MILCLGGFEYAEITNYVINYLVLKNNLRRNCHSLGESSLIWLANLEKYYGTEMKIRHSNAEYNCICFLGLRCSKFLLAFVAYL